MISSTGKGIRNDSEGDGNYGARRGSKRHNGTDDLCDEGQDVVAKFGWHIDRISYPKADHIMEGIKWSSGKSNGRMFYFKPDRSLIGQDVKEGQVIGIAQAVSKYYGLPNMADHIHFQINK